MNGILFFKLNFDLGDLNFKTAFITRVGLGKSPRVSESSFPQKGKTVILFGQLGIADAK